MASKNRYIPASVRAKVPIDTCANSPFKPATGCKNYICPMWIYNGGRFDESGFHIDHILELSHGGKNSVDNLQALCPSCHAVKTKRCSKQKWDFTSAEIDDGRSHMIE